MVATRSGTVTRRSSPARAHLRPERSPERFVRVTPAHPHGDYPTVLLSCVAIALLMLLALNILSELKVPVPTRAPVLSYVPVPGSMASASAWFTLKHWAKLFG